MDFRRRTVLYFIASAVAMLACPTGIAGCCCPKLWTGFREHCYRFFSHELIWQAAESFCRNFTVPSLGEWGEVTGNRSGHLVSIHSQAEQDFVTALYESSRKKGDINAGHWFGLHDTATEGTFEWTDGTPVDFTHWEPGQPDNEDYTRYHPDLSENENCGVMRSLSGNEWRDGRCEQPRNTVVHYFICKTPSL
uniref:SnEchinoidin n=1 Tax=Mesocentrotus nudus TaxID=7666 RepID=Q45FX4_MESNU|nr:snEchinoidin [Mesocentrotus nudus]